MAAPRSYAVIRDAPLFGLPAGVMSRRSSAGARLPAAERRIAHRVFASLRRPDLRRLRALVKEHYDQHGLGYWETTLLYSYRQVLRHPRDVGRPLLVGAVDLP